MKFPIAHSIEKLIFALKFTESVSCPWGKIVAIIFIFFSCNNVQKQRDNSMTEIFEWKTDYNSIANSKRRLFLQHLHNKKFTLDANGFFYINYSALIGVSRLEMYTDDNN